MNKSLTVQLQTLNLLIKEAEIFFLNGELYHFKEATQYIGEQFLKISKETEEFINDCNNS